MKTRRSTTESQKKNSRDFQHAKRLEAGETPLTGVDGRLYFLSMGTKGRREILSAATLRLIADSSK